MGDEIADMIAEYADRYVDTPSEEGKYWCKHIIRDLAGILCGDYIMMFEGDDDDA